MIEKLNEAIDKAIMEGGKVEMISISSHELWKEALDTSRHKHLAVHGDGRTFRGIPIRYVVNRPEVDFVLEQHPYL